MAAIDNKEPLSADALATNSIVETEEEKRERVSSKLQRYDVAELMKDTSSEPVEERVEKLSKEVRLIKGDIGDYVGKLCGMEVHAERIERTLFRLEKTVAELIERRDRPQARDSGRGEEGP